MCFVLENREYISGVMDVHHNFVMICVFTISHGQSHIERGFSVNKEITIENL